MQLRELLDAIDNDDQAELRLIGGKLRLRAPRHLAESPELVDIITAHRDLLVFHLLGIDTGHAIGTCSTCGQPSIVHVDPPQKGKYATCRITPGCEGRHEPRERDVRRRQHAPRQKAPKPPPRPPRKRFLGPMPAYPPHPSWRSAP